MDLQAGRDFFKLKESIEMLLVLPCPKLVAKLLQLSKTTRYLIWQFFVNYNMCKDKWLDLFLKNLWLYKNSSPRIPVETNNLYPTFVIPGDKRNMTPNKYYLCKMLHSKEILTINVLIGEFFLYFKESKISVPGWEMCNDIPTLELFEWYFIASALTIRLDKMIVLNASLRWERPILNKDINLLCSKVI